MAGINGFGSQNIMNMMLGKGSSTGRKGGFNASFQITTSSLVKGFTPDNRSYSVTRYDNIPFSNTGGMTNVPTYSRSTRDDPDTIFLSKSQPAMSEEDFKQAIVDLAKEERAKGISWGTSDKYKALSEQYISVASPDRAGVTKKSGFMIPADASHYVAKMVDDESGLVIGQYHGGKGWSIQLTQAERERSMAYDELYYAAYWGTDAEGSTSGNSSGSIKVEATESSKVDVKA